MEIEFKHQSYDRLEIDATFDAGFPLGVVKAYRKRISFIRGACDERDFYAMKSLHFEKLKGDRMGQFSMRLNDQWRLILEFLSGKNGKIVAIISIADYH
ncbi:MAG: type II toxin-antitoxin system RelE/ParE family toxin [Candidatus Nitrotoga sp.]|nr:type II toxin-antitoxin system RelE/ParE family toxin [Candidatus Nitrotoga sp.]